MLSEKRVRLLADHLRVTEPVNMDQTARRIIAARAQNLYERLRPNRPASELSFFTVVVEEGACIGVGGTSSFSLIAFWS